MSEISLTLVEQKQVNKTPTDMAKIAQKNEKITAFGGINFVLDKFDALLGDVIDRVLGIRSTSFGYQYSEFVRALFAVYLCGGDCMEDINLFLPHW